LVIFLKVELFSGDLNIFWILGYIPEGFELFSGDLNIFWILGYIPEGFELFSGDLNIFLKSTL